ncbi:MAG: GNAT family N-acetyltransferase [Caldimonas sp.]
MPITIQHVPQQHRFETRVDGEIGVAEYRIDGGVMELTHTEVAPALGGRGIGAALVQAALDHAQAHGLKVRALCPYARDYMQRHPATHALQT